MSQLLEDTTASAVSSAIAAERHKMGATATGMVLTFIIVTDELHQSEATRAATFAANQHPCRIIVVIPRPGRGKPQLDAEIWVGDRDGPGETVKLRLKGALAHHEASVVLPLLLPDTPVVVWWPANAPKVPADDPVGQLANRRVTDTSLATRPLRSLDERAESYHAGDTDLAWTRTTPWRSMLATALDEPYETILSGVVSGERNNASTRLLAGWLQAKLRVPVTVKNSRGPGVTSVALNTKNGDIVLERPDGEMATLTRSRGVTRKNPLPRRDLRDLVSEELRRLDADEVYSEALAEVRAGLGRDNISKPRAKTRSRGPGKQRPKNYGAMGTAQPPKRNPRGTSVPKAPAEEQARGITHGSATAGTAITPKTPQKKAATKKLPAKKVAAKKQAAGKSSPKKAAANKSVPDKPRAKKTSNPRTTTKESS